MNENNFVIKQQTIKTKIDQSLSTQFRPVTKWLIFIFSKTKYAGRDLIFFRIRSWKVIVIYEGECIKVLTICEIASVFWVSFDLIKRMVATPFFHSYVVIHCDSASRLATFFVQNNVS